MLLEEDDFYQTSINSVVNLRNLTLLCSFTRLNGTNFYLISVSEHSLVPLSEIYGNLCDEDVEFFDQIRRFKGPWLLSKVEDYDHKIVTASEAFGEFAALSRRCLANASVCFRRGARVSYRDDATLTPLLSFATSSVSQMGHAHTEVMGVNVKYILQKESRNTEHNTKMNKKLSDAFRAEEDVHVVLINHYADNKPFGNSLSIVHLKNKDSKCIYHLGVIKVLPAPK